MRINHTRKVNTEYYDENGNFIRREDKSYKEEVGVICDICKVKEGTKGWSGSSYIINENEISVTIKHKKGHSYPEGGTEIVYDFDICPTCFKDKIIPFLISEGCEIYEREIDW